MTVLLWTVRTLTALSVIGQLYRLLSPNPRRPVQEGDIATIRFALLVCIASEVFILWRLQ